MPPRRAAASAQPAPPPPEVDRSFPFAAGLLALAVLGGVAVLPRLARSNEPKGPAPAFVLPVIHNGDAGARLALGDLKGKPVLLDFWATWCGPCAAQTPILDRLARRYQGKGLSVVGVNVSDDDVDAARRYAAQKGLAYPIVADPTGEVQRQYGVNKLPTLVLVDKQGNIVRVASGLVDEASLDAMIRDVL